MHLLKALCERNPFAWALLILLSAYLVFLAGSGGSAQSIKAPKVASSDELATQQPAQQQVGHRLAISEGANDTSPANKNNKVASKKKNKQAGKESDDKRKESSKPKSNCEYERGEWQECQNGVQQRNLKLKPEYSANKCESIKTVRRNCLKGCKYVRGEWSANCENGLRVREDTLLASSGWAHLHSSLPEEAPLVDGCPAKRRVSKDCRRACHYLKSAWSECRNGFKTRNLTLQEWPPSKATKTAADLIKTAGGQKSGSPDKEAAGERRDNCKKSILIRRECKRRQVAGPSGIQQATKMAGAQAGNPNPNPNPRPLTAAQKRRKANKQRQQPDGSQTR